MARVSSYLNFNRKTEEAFNFYKTVFGTEFDGEIMRMDSDPSNPVAEEDKNLVIHVALPILGGHVLMGTDASESMGFKIIEGNNMHVNLEPDDLDEAKQIFKDLSAGGKVEMPLEKMFWGDYFASFTDKYGINWMINCNVKDK
ncbi:MAG TPA: VOC family protein [Candidatus Saccharimonadales bacterium]|nr:VOC family protein [Candidatus Saccharimonadales bacterium]